MEMWILNVIFDCENHMHVYLLDHNNKIEKCMEQNEKMGNSFLHSCSTHFIRFFVQYFSNKSIVHLYLKEFHSIILSTLK